MELKNLQDPLIISVIFFIIASDFFDGWLSDMFPKLASNRIGYVLVKALIFGAVYWLYRWMFNSTCTDPKLTKN